MFSHELNRLQSEREELLERSSELREVLRRETVLWKPHLAAFEKGWSAAQYVQAGWRTLQPVWALWKASRQSPFQRWASIGLELLGAITRFLGERDPLTEADQGAARHQERIREG